MILRHRPGRHNAQEETIPARVGVARNTKSVVGSTKAADSNHESSETFDGEVRQLLWNEVT